jgi:hypothetical protein
MAEYLNPPERVAEVGKPARKDERVPHGHVLVGVYFNGVWKDAPVLTPSDLEEFEGNYDRGAWLSRDFYHVPVDTAREMGARV